MRGAWEKAGQRVAGVRTRYGYPIFGAYNAGEDVNEGDSDEDDDEDENPLAKATPPMTAEAYVATGTFAMNRSQLPGIC